MKLLKVFWRVCASQSRPHSPVTSSQRAQEHFTHYEAAPLLCSSGFHLTISGLADAAGCRRRLSESLSFCTVPAWLPGSAQLLMFHNYTVRLSTTTFCYITHSTEGQFVLITRLESTGTSPGIWNLDFGLWTLDFFYGLRMTQDYQQDLFLSQRLLKHFFDNVLHEH
mgnify:CR=1 FL=1